MKNFKSYFGQIDASSVEIANLLKNHLNLEIENSVKIGDNQNGDQIIIGIKGSGKTHLRRKIEGELSSEDILFNLNTDHAQFNLDANDIDEHSGRLKNYISLEFARILVNYINNLNPETKSKWQTVKDNLLSVKEAFKQVLKDSELDVPYIKIDLKSLFNSEDHSLVQSAWQNMIDDLVKVLDDCKIYILIDDAEDVFKNLEKSPDFIEALCRSVKDINQRSGNKIHVILFMKKGIWRIWFEANREYDKVKDVIHFLSWDKDDVLDVITKRISEMNSIEFDSENRMEIWSKEFDFENRDEFDKLTDYMFSLVINGPRDIIEIANVAKVFSKSEKINIDNVVQIESKYSQEKLYGINADFGDIYPLIHKFIEIVFNGESFEMSGEKLIEIIESKGLTVNRVAKQLSSAEWFDELGKEQIALVLYKIGFFNIEIDGKYYHSLEKQDIKMIDILNNNIQVHPAFRSHLGMS